MHSIRSIGASMLLSTLLSYSAAHEVPPKSIDEITTADLIGLACSERGSCGIKTLLNKQQNNPSFSITLVYSEHPELQEPAVLTRIAQEIDAKKTFSDRAAFRALCTEEILKDIDALNNNNNEYIDPGIAFLALCIKIKANKIREIVCRQRLSLRRAHAGEALCLLKKSYHKLIQQGLRAMPSNEPIKLPQEEAITLQTDNPSIPFHLVVDLDLWGRIAALRRKELKREREQALAASPCNHPFIERQ